MFWVRFSLVLLSLWWILLLCWVLVNYGMNNIFNELNKFKFQNRNPLIFSLNVIFFVNTLFRFQWMGIFSVLPFHVWIYALQFGDSQLFWEDVHNCFQKIWLACIYVIWKVILKLFQQRFDSVGPLFNDTNISTGGVGFSKVGAEKKW